MASTINASTTLGLISSADTSGVLQLQTANTAALTIDASQNLGVGTASPSAKVHVAGNILSVGGNYFADTTSGYFWAGNGSYSGGIYGSNSGNVANLVSPQTIILRTASTDRLTVDSTGNLGLGATPSAWANSKAIDLGAFGALSCDTATSGAINVAYNAYAISATSWKYKVSSVPASRYNQDSSGQHQWFVAASGTAGNAISFTQAMSLLANGSLCVGTTTQLNGGSLNIYGAATSAPLANFFSSTAGDVGNAILNLSKQDNNTTTSQVFLRCGIASTGAGAGQINMNGANSLAFGTFSDARLKENIVNLPPQLENILALRPVEFDYIQSEGGGHQTGFIAQEIQQVYSDAVGEREDGMLTVSGWDKTTARLVKAIQEQQAIIQQLQADVAALKGTP